MLSTRWSPTTSAVSSPTPRTSKHILYRLQSTIALLAELAASSSKSKTMEMERITLVIAERGLMVSYNESPADELHMSFLIHLVRAFFSPSRSVSAYCCPGLPDLQNIARKHCYPTGLANCEPLEFPFFCLQDLVVSCPHPLLPKWLLSVLLALLATIPPTHLYVVASPLLVYLKSISVLLQAYAI